MNKVNKSGVPALRFPEFKNAPVWGGKKLGDYLDYLQPTKYLVESTAYNDNYKIPVLTAGKTFILGYTNEINGIFENNLPVIIFDDFTTATKFVDLPFKAKSSAMKILLAKDNANIKFIYELMQTIEHEVGNHQRHWISKFSTLNVFIPKPKEQQKIADCLTSLDDLITAQSQKVDSLKQHKKGLMQQLFPAKGKNTPALRFPEFKNAPAWEEKKIENVGEIITGKTPSTKKPELWNGDIEFITPTDIYNKHQQNTSRKVVKTEKMKILPIGSIAYTCIASIGKMTMTTKKSITNQQINSIIVNQSNSNEFIYYLLLVMTPYIKSQANKTFAIINKQDFSKLKIFTPKPPEQQKIADCLTSLDELIDAQSQKLLSLKQHKKGLMQKLFPEN